MQGLACFMPPRIQDGHALATTEYQPINSDKFAGTFHLLIVYP